jgi:multidrug resistance efflux pump
VELAQAKEHLARQRRLALEHLISQEALVAADYQEKLAAGRLAATRAQLEERRAQVERLQKDNGDLEITAPFEGIVATRYVDPGATVRPSTPILRLISMRDIFVRFAIPEPQVRVMAVGQAVRIRVGDARLELLGTVEKVAPEVDSASHLVVLEARILSLDPEIPVLSGEIARVSRMGSP